jgi:uncharacterized protein
MRGIDFRGQISHKEKVFLSADWRDLVMLNYQVDPDLLRKHIPAGTTLDAFNGKAFISLVGFRFGNTKMFGSLPIPFHTDFDEVNLRFYVRRGYEDEERRGVVFIAEIVAKLAISTIARLAYNENYVCLPMRHRIAGDSSKRSVEYAWKFGGKWCSLSASVSGEPVHPQHGSVEQFITEHFWGYSAQPNGGSLEYHVEHVPWRVWTSTTAQFEGDVRRLYGAELAETLKGRPDSAFIAEGSQVLVYKGTKILRA